LKLRITIEGRVYEAEVEILESEEGAPEYPAYPAPPPAFVPASVPAPEIAQHQAEMPPHCENECRSPVTGMVIEVNVVPGQPVEAEEVVAVLESMKMEMRITAPRAGVVKSVLVESGATVKVNQLLVEFE
jgi:biotin carboxyl carrier protein